MNIFIGIIIGIIIWQTIAFVLTLITDLDPDWSKWLVLGIWSFIWVGIIKPIFWIYERIWAVRFNHTYCNFVFFHREKHDNKLHYSGSFFIKKILAEKYVTYSRQDIESINEDGIVVREEFHYKEKLPKSYHKEELTEQSITKGLRGWSAEGLQKYLRIKEKEQCN